MHLAFGLHGIKQDVDLAIKFLETRTFPLPVVDKEGKEFTVMIQSQFRPIPFINAYELIFPRGCLDSVLNTLKPQTSISLVDGKGGSKFKAHLMFLRKLLGLKKIPEAKNKEVKFPFPEGLNIRLIGIGIKDDIDMTFDNGLTHEAI